MTNRDLEVVGLWAAVLGALLCLAAGVANAAQGAPAWVVAFSGYGAFWGALLAVLFGARRRRTR